jgi:hypothetical protein
VEVRVVARIVEATIVIVRVVDVVAVVRVAVAWLPEWILSARSDRLPSAPLRQYAAGHLLSSVKTNFAA